MITFKYYNLYSFIKLLSKYIAKKFYEGVYIVIFEIDHYPLFRTDDCLDNL